MKNNDEKYIYDYPHPAVTTDCVVFGFDGRELVVLLIERGREPFKGMWAFPGGFLRINETAEECAHRELLEETGLDLKFMKQLGVFSGLKRDPRERVISIAFYSLAKNTAVKGSDDAANARWWRINDVPQLAFDHDYILRQALQKIRKDIHFEPVGFDLLGEKFTISELQRLYEAILGIQFDRRNFYKKILQTGIIKEYECVKEEPSRFFGRGGEMKSMDISQLFGGAPKKCKSSHGMSARREAPCVYNEDDMIIREESDSYEYRQGTGRKGKLYSFDKESYEKMKENGNFRLEF